VAGKTVLEAGALDVNGSVRGHIESLRPASCTGTDMRAGPGVDVVCAAEDLPRRFAGVDLVVCTEMLEHAADWRAAMAGMAGVLAPGGLLLLTARGPGFPPHGYPEDYWRFTVAAMAQILAACGLEAVRLEADSPMPGVLVLARKTGEPGDLSGIGVFPVG
jgi:SAM-dependent methyltransferase